MVTKFELTSGRYGDDEEIVDPGQRVRRYIMTSGVTYLKYLVEEVQTFTNSIKTNKLEGVQQRHHDDCTFSVIWDIQNFVKGHAMVICVVQYLQ